MTDYNVLDIRPLIQPGHATRRALILAYRNGLGTSPSVAWADTLAVAQERFPLVELPHLQRMLLLWLGLFGTDVRERLDGDESPDPDGRVPCLISGELRMRLDAAARHYGVTIDDLVSRLVSAWLEAACDFVGVPGDEIPAPPPLR